MNQTNSDEEGDYQFEKTEPNNSHNNLYCEDSDNEDGGLSTTLSSTDYMKGSSKKRIQKQIDKLKRMKNTFMRNMNKDPNESPKKRLCKKDQKTDKVALGIGNAVREDTVHSIESKLNKIPKFASSHDFIKNSAITLEEYAFRKCAEKVTKPYLTMVKVLYANLNTLRIWRGINQLILNNEIKIVKLYTPCEKFIEKWKYLEGKMHNISEDCQENKVKIPEFIEDPKPAKLNKDFEKIRNENKSEVDRWMKLTKVHPDSLQNSKPSECKQVTYSDSGMKSRLSGLVKQNEDSDGSTRSEKDISEHSTHSNEKENKVSQNSTDSGDLATEKPKLRMKDSPLKKWIEEIRETEVQK